MCVSRQNVPQHSSAADAPEVSFAGLLLKIEAHQAASQAQGQQGASHGVHEQHDEEGRVDGVQDAGEGDQVDRRVQQRLAQRQRAVCELPATTLSAWGMSVWTRQNQVA